MVPYIKQCEEYWIVQDDEGYGNAIVLKTPWSRRYFDIIRRYKVKRVRLNECLGWVDSDLSFLLEIPGLIEVSIISDLVTDVSPVFQIKRLKTMSLYCKAKVAGDFTQLRDLQEVGLEWRNVFQPVFELSALRRIHIIGYPHKDLTPWTPNKGLEQLLLESRKLENLGGIERFPNVRLLNLFRCRKLTSLAELVRSPSIQELQIDGCPSIEDWSPISKLNKLRVLEIENCKQIASVVPFSKCQKLERLQLAGNTTVVNGDLSSLNRLPNLREVLLARRMHYSHIAAELKKR